MKKLQCGIFDLNGEFLIGKLTSFELVKSWRQ